jgi:hypothetical protein
METYLDGTGYNTYGIQKWDTGFSGGIVNFESWYPSRILRKKFNFKPCTDKKFKFQTLLRGISCTYNFMIHV